MEEKKRNIEKVVHKYKLGEEPKDRDYWLTKSPEECLDALNFLIQQFHTENEIKSGLQGFARIIKRSELDKEENDRRK